MAGETSIVHRHHAPRCVLHGPGTGEIRLGWLRAFWFTLLVLELVGVAVSLGAGHDGLWAAAATATVASMVGAPLFGITWLWLAGTPRFRHAPFVLLVVLWVAAAVGRRPFVPADSVPAAVLVLLGVPVASTLEVLRQLLRAMRRQDEAREAPGAR